MSIELRVSLGTSQRNVYAMCWDDLERSTQGWDNNASQFAEFAVANWANFAVHCSEHITDSGIYVGSWDPGAPGRYYVIFYQQIGSSPDKNDPTVGVQDVYYNGVEETGVPESPYVDNGRTGMPIRMPLAYSGQHLYVIAWDKSGQVYNWTIPGLSTWSAASVVSYGMYLLEDATGSRCANLYWGVGLGAGAGVYDLQFFQRTGTQADISDPQIGAREIYHNGLFEVGSRNDIEKVQQGGGGGTLTEDEAQLAAINRMLRTLGEPPVDSLSTDTTGILSEAKTILGSVSRRIQSQGWACNTTLETSLLANQQSEVPVPSNIITIRGVQHGTGTLPRETDYDTRLTIRNQKIYRQSAASYFFAQGYARVEAVVLLKYANLPPSLYEYIVQFASLEFERYKKRGAIDEKIGEEKLQRARHDAVLEDIYLWRFDDDVNRVLQALGDPPPQVDKATGKPVVIEAAKQLQRSSIKIQSKGWASNIVIEKEMIPDSSGHIAVPKEVIAIQSVLAGSGNLPRTLNSDIRVTIKEDRLYNQTHGTYYFYDPIYCEQIVLTELDKLPEELHNYIIADAAYVFGGYKNHDEPEKRTDNPLLRLRMEAYNAARKEDAYAWRSNDTLLMVLQALGDPPPKNTDTEGVQVVREAMTVLNDTSKQIQAQKWACNTVLQKTYSPDSNGHITIADNVLEVRPVYDGYGIHLRNSNNQQMVTVRDGKLYDLANNTDVFDEDITLEVVMQLDLSDLPPMLKDYIVKDSALRFERYKVNNQARGRALAIQAADARMNANREDGDTQRLNVFNRPEVAAVRGAFGRHNYLINPRYV